MPSLPSTSSPQQLGAGKVLLQHRIEKRVVRVAVTDVENGFHEF